MGQLIDTSVLIQVERKQLTIGDLISSIPEDDVAVSSITAAELLAGVERAKESIVRVRRSAFVEDVPREIPIIPVDLSVARIHAVVRAQLATSGQLIGPHDLIIAATAIAYSYDVVTENTREFSRVAGLQTRHPDWP